MLLEGTFHRIFRSASITRIFQALVNGLDVKFKRVGLNEGLFALLVGTFVGSIVFVDSLVTGKISRVVEFLAADFAFEALFA